MKAVILAGGLGTRIYEETKSKPKPMIKIGNKPILWHIMKIYSHYGINDFVVCCGYKSNIIKEYFKENKIPWEVKLVDTGLKTMTGGRLKKVEKYLDNDTFCFTYGDTLNDVNIKKLIKFHQSKKKLATVTACHPPEKYGVLKLQNEKVTEFKEKPKKENEWVNGGFFVLEPNIFDYIKNDKTIWEKDPMKKLVKMNQLIAYRHNGFYQPMDTMSDKKILDDMWKRKNASWKVWK
jgi:glucose-1-phosphate cytidylyltransferase